jgi:hypothetical protein
MQHKPKRTIVAAGTLGLMAASIVALVHVPAMSSVHPGTASRLRCDSKRPCVAGTNTGTGGAVYGTTTKANGGNGVSGFGNNPVASGVYGVDSAGGYGVSGSTQGASGIGAGVFGLSGNGNPAAALQVSTSATGAPVLRANNSTGQIALLDDSGNLTISGLLKTAGSCSSGCTRTRHVGAYASREASPTMEDVGEGRLVSGRAFVRIDAAFANAIDGSAGYAVLVTPEGDSKGLFVMNRTAGGFEVRENQAGRSSVDFFYRIVAHPYGVRAARLPMIQDRPMAPLPRFATQ